MLANDQRQGVLPDRIGLGRAGAGRDQMQAPIARMIHRRADGGGGKVRRNIPRWRQCRFEIAVLNEILADARGVAGNQNHVVEIHVA